MYSQGKGVYSSWLYYKVKCIKKNERKLKKCAKKEIKDAKRTYQTLVKIKVSFLNGNEKSPCDCAVYQPQQKGK